MSIKGYEWLDTLDKPRLVVEALKEFGVTETPGKASNAKIMGWAAEIGQDVIGWKYTDDSVPWCGLFVATMAQRAGKPLAKNPLYALNWATYGSAADKPSLGDILTFKRDGGGHVGIYIAEDDVAYHVLGGNQSDKVCISRILKKRLYKARRVPFKVAMPDSVKPYLVASNGVLSTNEA